MRVVTFITETGSTYQLRDDAEGMRWYRNPTKKSGVLRTESGTLTAWPIITLGATAVLIGPPIVEGTDNRAVITSRVVGIRNEIR